MSIILLFLMSMFSCDRHDLQPPKNNTENSESIVAKLDDFNIIYSESFGSGTITKVVQNECSYYEVTFTQSDPMLSIVASIELPLIIDNIENQNLNSINICQNQNNYGIQIHYQNNIYDIKNGSISIMEQEMQDNRKRLYVRIILNDLIGCTRNLNDINVCSGEFSIPPLEVEVLLSIEESYL